MTSTLYRREIEVAAAAHQLDPNLLEALVITESSGLAHAFRFEPGFYKRYLAKDAKYAGQNPMRISSSYGLCQVMYTTALEHDFAFPDPEYLFVPAVNLEFGCRHLGMLLEWADGDEMKALAAYNGGQGNWMALAPQSYATRVSATLVGVREAHRAG